MALDATTDDKPTNVAGERLRSIVDRIERLEEERKALGSDIKDIYAEAKSARLDPAGRVPPRAWHVGGAACRATGSLRQEPNCHTCDNAAESRR